jgi:hypothetical protein
VVTKKIKVMSTFTIVIGLIDIFLIGFWVGVKITRKLFEGESQHIRYLLDVTLRNPFESVDDFIKRAYRENLGRYDLISYKKIIKKINE